MVSTCFYFQVHQPFRLQKRSIFDVGSNKNYFDDQKNQEIMQRVANKCYLPANKLLLELIRKTDGKFKASFSITGTALEQFENKFPEVLESFMDLADTGNVEFLSETYHHSLSFIYSKPEFRKQVLRHKALIKRYFKQSPKVLRNTELIYNNELALLAEKLGYKGVIAEGADHVLQGRNPNFLYTAKNSKIKLLLKNYKLSDDIAFRFSEKSWNEYPLDAEKFAAWMNNINGDGNTINLFMDYETFGEHQWKESGIFKFMEHLPSEILKNHDNDFVTPSEAISRYNSFGEIDSRELFSWADIERDTSAWLGNKMQLSAINELYKLEKQVIKSNNSEIIELWRKLQTSDHFYYMCTKYFADGDVHKYFNHYDTPYDAFVTYMNVLNDLKLRLKRKTLRMSFA